MSRRSKIDCGDGDGGFDAKLKTALKKKSLIDVQQLLRGRQRVRRAVTKVKR